MKKNGTKANGTNGAKTNGIMPQSPSTTATIPLDDLIFQTLQQTLFQVEPKRVQVGLLSEQIHSLEKQRTVLLETLATQQQQGQQALAGWLAQKGLDSSKLSVNLNVEKRTLTYGPPTVTPAA